MQSHWCKEAIEGIQSNNGVPTPPTSLPPPLPSLNSQLPTNAPDTTVSPSHKSGPEIINSSATAQYAAQYASYYAQFALTQYINQCKV